MKLFEFEKLEEGLDWARNIKGIWVMFNTHAKDRANQYGIDLDMVNEVVKKVPDLRNKFKELPDGHKFSVWSKSKNMGVSLRKYADKDGYQRVEVMTTIKKLYDSDDNPAFFVG